MLLISAHGPGELAGTSSSSVVEWRAYQSAVVMIDPRYRRDLNRPAVESAQLVLGWPGGRVTMSPTAGMVCGSGILTKDPAGWSRRVADPANQLQCCRRRSGWKVGKVGPGKSVEGVRGARLDFPTLVISKFPLKVGRLERLDMVVGVEGVRGICLGCQRWLYRSFHGSLRFGWKGWKGWIRSLGWGYPWSSPRVTTLAVFTFPPEIGSGWKGWIRSSERCPWSASRVADGGWIRIPKLVVSGWIRVADEGWIQLAGGGGLRVANSGNLLVADVGWIQVADGGWTPLDAPPLMMLELGKE